MTANILVVDDESVTRRVVMHALRSMAVEVIGAENGQEALARAQQQPLALAIVDINLPDMDGFAVMRQLHSLPHLQTMPIVVFTARNHPGDVDAALEAGAAGFLYKPFSTQELRDTVAKHLGQA